MKRISIVVCIVFSIWSCTTSPYQRKIKSIHNKEFKRVQSEIPQDMMLINGNDSVADFCISQMQEPNIFYVVYLQWLNRVFETNYPEIVLDAIPRRDDQTKITSLEDPYLQEYLFNPKFAYYPAVNLTWDQIQKYLAWKNDRYNEHVLIREGILKTNLVQINEDNFNTEAYINGQYHGLVKDLLIDEKKGGFRRVELRDGFLSLGYRLPTYQEVETANNYSGEETIKKPYKSSSYRPFGKNHFLIKYSVAMRFDFSSNSPLPLLNYDVMAKLNHDDQLDSNQHFPTQSIVDENQKEIKPMKLNSEIDEWILDVYSSKNDFKSDWEEVLINAGYVAKKDFPKMYNEEYDEKDKLGQMNGHRFYGYASKSKPIIYSQSAVKLKRSIRTKDGIKPCDQQFSSSKLGFRVAMNHSQFHKH